MKPILVIALTLILSWWHLDYMLKCDAIQQITNGKYGNAAGPGLSNLGYLIKAQVEIIIILYLSYFCAVKSKKQNRNLGLVCLGVVGYVLCFALAREFCFDYSNLNNPHWLFWYDLPHSCLYAFGGVAMINSIWFAVSNVIFEFLPKKLC